jgi:hypothetical protein
MVKWKTGLSCRSRTAIIGKQVNFGLEISMNDTFYLISSQHLVQNEYIVLILNINLRHSNLFPSQTELKVNGHHHIHMSDPNSKSSGILSDGPVKDILRPALASLRCTKSTTRT